MNRSNGDIWSDCGHSHTDRATARPTQDRGAPPRGITWMIGPTRSELNGSLGLNPAGSKVETILSPNLEVAR